MTSSAFCVPALVFLLYHVERPLHPFCMSSFLGAHLTLFFSHVGDFKYIGMLGVNCKSEKENDLKVEMDQTLFT